MRRNQEVQQHNRTGTETDRPLPDPLPLTESRRASTAMMVVAVLLSLYMMYFARSLLMPIVAGVIIALLFRPLVRRLRRYGIPTSVSAAVVLMGLIGFAFGAFANLLGPAQAWMENAPDNLAEIGRKLNVLRDEVQELNRASEVVEELARGEAIVSGPATVPETAPFPFASEEGDSDAPAPAATLATGAAIASASRSGVSEPDPELQKEALAEAVDDEEPIQVQIRQPRLMAGLTVLTSTGSIVGGILMALVLAYFLLATGDMLINNVLHILPSMREKRNAVELVYNVERGISDYLLTVSAINLCLGLIVALAMWLLGLPNPLLWGAMATILNFVPFLGALCGVVMILLVSILTFDSITYALVPPLVFLAITSTEGNLVTPHLLGRSMSLNPIMVFLALAVWGWMWGVGGAFLAVPILAILKVGFDQFERTRPLGTLLGGGSET